MKPAPWDHLAKFRIDGHPDEPQGVFRIPHPPTAVDLLVIASSDDGWEHVSVSLPKRTTNWREMDFICRQFWNDDETVMQLHPPRAEWVNNHPYCLHLWRPIDEAIPRPPMLMVGIQHLGQIDRETAQRVALSLMGDRD